MSEQNQSVLPCFEQTEFSPMTEISINLSGTKISHLHTRKRRLSLTIEESDSLDNFTLGSSENTIQLNAKSFNFGRKCLQDITNTPASSPKIIKTTNIVSTSRCLIDSPTRPHVDGEISLYGGATPDTRSPESSPEISKKGVSRLRQKNTLRRDCLFGHGSSLDSGLGCSFQEHTLANHENKSIQFLEPSEPEKIKSSKSLFRGLSDFEHSKDEFFDLLEVDKLDEPTLPVNFNKLVSCSILTDIAKNTPKLKDCRTPVRSRLFTSSSPQTTPITHFKENHTHTQVSLKRSKSLFDSSDKLEKKRHKIDDEIASEPKNLDEACLTPKPVLKRSMSICSPNTIMTAVQRSSVEPDLIGDFSKPFILPLVPGRHQDLKSITPSTLAKLLRGEYSSTVSSYKVIDCRYPYEYQGGHIRGALNYYTKDQIEIELFNIRKHLPASPSTSSESSLSGLVKRDIVIFHCEFSAQRGPKLFRFLRAIDRNHNNDVYPALHYPEMYLLEGGYKRFFESYSELCQPVAYKPMNDPAHEDECRLFRAQKRSCNAPTAGRKLMSKRSALEF